MQEKIKTILRANLDPEIYEFGFADLRGLLSQQYSSFTHCISIMRKLDDAIIDGITEGPTIEYFDLYHAVNRELNEKVALLATELSAGEWQFQPIKATVADFELDDNYRQTLTYTFSHKMAATRSGLGWIGKTDLLISRRFGPRMRLASILTNFPLALTAKPIDRALCGNCKLCTEICPAQAANGIVWDIHTHRDEFFDAFRCQAYCRKISKSKIDKEISLCGKCVLVCPFGKKA